MPKRKQNMNDRDKINYILSRVRIVLSMRFIPIQSYASASSKSDVIRNYMILKVEKEPIEETLTAFEQIINKLDDVRDSFLEKTIKALSDEEQKLLKVYFATDMSLKETCEQVFLHKNTLQYKLDKIGKETGFNPRKFKEAAILYLALKMKSME